MAFKHFIITRFWEDVPRLKKTKFSDPSDWIDSRADLFNDIYIRGLNNQTNDSFETILLISKKFIKYDLNKFNLSQIKHKKIEAEAFYTDPSIILSPEDKNLDYIITSRLDSDDLLAKHYINNVQKRSSRNAIIDHDTYMMLSPSFMNFSRKSSDCNSMFISTCFDPKEIKDKHCYSSPHLTIYKKFIKKIIIRNIGSAAICHGHNVSNKIDHRNAQPITLDQFHKIFGKI